MEGRRRDLGNTELLKFKVKQSVLYALISQCEMGQLHSYKKV